MRSGPAAISWCRSHSGVVSAGRDMDSAATTSRPTVRGCFFCARESWLAVTVAGSRHHRHVDQRAAARQCQPSGAVRRDILTKASKTKSTRTAPEITKRDVRPYTWAGSVPVAATTTRCTRRPAATATWTSTLASRWKVPCPESLPYTGSRRTGRRPRRMLPKASEIRTLNRRRACQAGNTLGSQFPFTSEDAARNFTLFQRSGRTLVHWIPRLGRFVCGPRAMSGPGRFGSGCAEMFG